MGVTSDADDPRLSVFGAVRQRHHLEDTTMIWGSVGEQYKQVDVRMTCSWSRNSRPRESFEDSCRMRQ